MNQNIAVPELAELTSPAVDRLKRSEWLIVWPVASLEQHGRHLPLGTDAIILEAVVQRVRASLGSEFKALFLPMLRIGLSPEHLNFAGTMSLRASTLISVAEDIVASCAHHGFKRIVFMNGHGGNTAILQGIAQDLRKEYGVVVYNLDLWASTVMSDTIENLFPKLAGAEVHAASAETSVLLYLRPELVGAPPGVPTEPTLAATTVIEKLGPVPWGWLSEDFGQSGVIGDQTSASVTAGEKLLTVAVSRVGWLLQQIQGTKSIE